MHPLPKKYLGGPLQRKRTLLLVKVRILKGILAFVFMTSHFCLKSLAHGVFHPLPNVFMYSVSFDVQSDLPKIGKEVLIYKGRERNRNLGGVSYLLLVQSS